MGGWYSGNRCVGKCRVDSTKRSITHQDTDNTLPGAPRASTHRQTDIPLVSCSFSDSNGKEEPSCGTRLSATICPSISSNCVGEQANYNW